MEGGGTFTVSHRLTRMVWDAVWTLLAVWNPRQWNAWRRFLLRLFGAKIDPTARIHPGVRVWYPPNLTMHAQSTLGPKVICYSMAPITLEAYALASQGAHLCAGTHDIDDPHFSLVASPITLKARSWVAAEAFVGPGVTIGEGAVLGARAVTVKDLAPWGVYVGNPAKFLRERKRVGDEEAA